jgi:hypothetical protein
MLEGLVALANAKLPERLDEGLDGHMLGALDTFVPDEGSLMFLTEEGRMRLISVFKPIIVAIGTGFNKPQAPEVFMTASEERPTKRAAIIDEETADYIAGKSVPPGIGFANTDLRSIPHAHEGPSVAYDMDSGYYTDQSSLPVQHSLLENVEGLWSAVSPSPHAMNTLVPEPLTDQNGDHLEYWFSDPYNQPNNFGAHAQ